MHVSGNVHQNSPFISVDYSKFTNNSKLTRKPLKMETVSKEPVLYSSFSNYPNKRKTEPITQRTQNQLLLRERSVEETEAAHDLLSLSQSLPPLLAPCVVKILKDDGNHCIISSSPVMQEISNSSNFKISNANDNKEKLEWHENESTNAKDIWSVYKNNNTEYCSPLTPPNSEPSSDVEIDNFSTSDSSNQSTNHNHLQGFEKHCYSELIEIKKEKMLIVDGRTRNKKCDNKDTTKSKKHKTSIYKCSECGKQYATSSNLSRHKQTHRSLDSQSAKKCNTCGKAYVSMPALAMHLLTHKLRHSCDICGKLFSRPWLLQGHLRSHTGEKPYACTSCGKPFADRSNLRAHMQTHSSDKNYKCSRCNKTFALKSYLNKHLESTCLKEKFNNSIFQNVESEFNFYKERDLLQSSDEDDDIIVI